MFGSDHPAGMGTPRRFVERFRPGFFSRVPTAPRA